MERLLQLEDILQLVLETESRGRGKKLHYAGSPLLEINSIKKDI